MVVGVLGDKNFKHERKVIDVLGNIKNIELLVTGSRVGACKFAEQWAARKGIMARVYGLDRNKVTSNAAIAEKVIGDADMVVLFYETVNDEAIAQVNAARAAGKIVMLNKNTFMSRDEINTKHRENLKKQGFIL